jgi:hypothetical protein
MFWKFIILNETSYNALAKFLSCHRLQIRKVAQGKKVITQDWFKKVRFFEMMPHWSPEAWKMVIPESDPQTIGEALVARAERLPLKRNFWGERRTNFSTLREQDMAQAEPGKTPREHFTEWRHAADAVVARISGGQINDAALRRMIRNWPGSRIRSDQKMNSSRKISRRRTSDPVDYRTALNRIGNQITPEHPEYRTVVELLRDPRAAPDLAPR